jgi:uncharacterized protein (DUF58 family)
MASRVAAAPAAWFARARQRAFRREPADTVAVVLRHSRIYILPTRRGLAAIGTLATMLLTSLNYGMSLGFVVTFLLTGMVGAALLHTFRNLAGIEIRPLAASETFAGSRVTFTLSLDGRGTARSAITLAAREGASAVHELPADGREVATLEIGPVRRGVVPLGRVTLWSDFPLGLWRGWAYVHFPLAGLAYPEPEIGAPPLPPATVGSDLGAIGGSDDAELAGLREYQVGDPLQRVAWKAVARGGGWYTKQFDGAGGGGPVLLDWFALPGHLATEARLSRLSAWAVAGERAARRYALRLPDVLLPPGQGREHRRAVLAALALYDSDGA